MNTSNLINTDKQKRALMLIDKLEREKDVSKKVKLIVGMMTYYDETNAHDFQLFCMDILTDSSIYGRDCKLRDKIIELENIKKNNDKLQKDIQKLKILFDSEFCRCSECGEYKRSGFGCSCENE